MTDDDPRMERFIDAVQAANELGGTEDFQALVTRTLQMMGQDFLPHLRAADTGGLFCPVAVETDRKPLIGATVLLPDRLVVVWRHGFTGGKKGSTTVRLDQVRSVTATHFPSGPRAGTRVLAIQSAEPLKLAVPAVVGEPLYLALLKGIDVREG